MLLLIIAAWESRGVKGSVDGFIVHSPKAPCRPHSCKCESIGSAYDVKWPLRFGWRLNEWAIVEWHHCRVVVTSWHQSRWMQMKCAAHHPTRGRRRKVNGPPILPRLLISAVKHRLDTSSGDLGEESGLGQEPKRQRSTSTTPVRLWHLASWIC